MKDNVVDGNSYSGPNWTSTGILLFEASGVHVQGNTVTHNQSGVTIESWCWIVPSAGSNHLVHNTITDSQWGVSIAAYAVGGYSGCDPSASGNKVTNNTIASTGGDTGIFVGTGVFSGSTYVPVAANNKLTANTISGFATGIDNSGTGTKAHANAVSP